MRTLINQEIFNDLSMLELDYKDFFYLLFINSETISYNKKYYCLYISQFRTLRTLQNPKVAHIFVFVLKY